MLRIPGFIFAFGLSIQAIADEAYDAIKHVTLMSNEENGKNLRTGAESRAVCSYQILPGIDQCGVYKGSGFEEATRLAVEWFDQHLRH